MTPYVAHNAFPVWRFKCHLAKFCLFKQEFDELLGSYIFGDTPVSPLPIKYGNNLAGGKDPKTEAIKKIGDISFYQARCR